jgi:hypothetical protein
MPDLSTLFAYAVAVLAGLAVLAVLAFIVVWAVLGIRRELARARDRTTIADLIYAAERRVAADPSTRYWREHSAVTVPDSIVPPPAP